MKALDLDYYRPDLAWSLLEERYPNSSLSTLRVVHRRNHSMISFILLLLKKLF
jgi:hypothetical protein